MNGLEEVELIIANDEYGFERLLQLSYDNDAEVRLRAIEALYPFSDTQEIIHRIREALDDYDELVRVASIEILGDWEDNSSVSKIINCLNDEQWLVRAYAAIALCKLGDRIAVEVIESKICYTSNDEELLRYYMALWCLGKKQYRVKALELLEHPEYRVRCAVANLLLECKDYVEINEDIVKKLDDALKKEKTEASRSSILNTIRNLK
jgi:HEAT repeat protein